MNRNEIIQYCFSKPAVWDDLPFDDKTLVMKIGNKMFILFGTEEPLRINLKSDPIISTVLRKKYKSMLPGYHMNKKHWNTVIIDGSIPDDVICKMIDNSYNLVLNSLTKSEKDKINKGFKFWEKREKE
ncbi:MAG: MmcQ/YjbR family DNA-binding protein [Candidatus Cloacimonetes bacterium]|nr:MmcQ/YjbR family DNA-binding protein [Candidatus Cloacimonadota bacterium]